MYYKVVILAGKVVILAGFVIFVIAVWSRVSLMVYWCGFQDRALQLVVLNFAVTPILYLNSLIFLQFGIGKQL